MGAAWMSSSLERSERLLTKSQLGERLGCDRRTVDRWLEQGIIPTRLRVRLGSLVRFRESAVDEWIADGCKAGER